MSDPTTTNNAETIINGIVNALISGGETAAKAYLVTLDPTLLADPIVSWLSDEVLGYISQVISIAGEKFIDAIVTKLQTDAEGADVLNTGTALAIAIASKNQVAIDSAVAAASAAYKSAFNFDGWADPT